MQIVLEKAGNTEMVFTNLGERLEGFPGVKIGKIKDKRTFLTNVTDIIFDFLKFPKLHFSERIYYQKVYIGCYKKIIVLKNWEPYWIKTKVYLEEGTPKEIIDAVLELQDRDWAKDCLEVEIRR